MAQQLAEEARVFEEHIEEWRQSHLGQFVLIKGSDVLGVFPTLDKAFRAGTERFGLEPFFVKQIVPADSVNVSLLGQRILASRR
jgi:hypothetical protein